MPTCPAALAPNRRPLLLACLPVLLASAAGPQDPAAPDDERVLQAWSFLTAEEQEDVAAWFVSEVTSLSTLQSRLLRQALALEEADPGLLPDDPGLAWFDPVDHAPGQPIPRELLEADDPRVEAVHERILGARPAPAFPSAWRYDWGRREVVRRADFRAAQHVFALALAGYAPQADLAVALVERQLDRGEQQLALGAFGHAYTDREGLVFGGVTLYDAWSSGLEIEMPDVDNLGIVHSITGERGRWTAPIPAEQHDELYGIVGELFADAHHYRGLRTALAATYLVGSAPLADGYLPHLDRLHGLWGEYESDPTELCKVLPRSEDWADYMPGWAVRFDKDGTRLARARSRQTQLEWDAVQVRALLVRLLEQVGAFERTGRPKPKPERKPPEGGGR